MEYRSISELNDRVAAWSATLNADPELVVGVSPGGLLAANLFAMHRALPVTDLAGLLKGRIPGAGQRCAGQPVDRILQRPARILVIEDIASSSTSLAEARQSIDTANLPHGVSFGAVFATPQAIRDRVVTCFAEMLRGPTVFEWNIMHSPALESCCVDIDGVLCVDPRPEENDDGPRYAEFLRNARPLALPRHEVGWLVTSRLERYRAETEDWLARHGVRHRHLLMMDYPDQAARQKARAYDSFKAAAYLDTGADLFIESAPHTAAGVARIASRPVFCFDRREMIYPGTLARRHTVAAQPRHPAAHILRRTVSLPVRIIRRIYRMAGQRRSAARPVEPLE